MKTDVFQVTMWKREAWDNLARPSFNETDGVKLGIAAIISNNFLPALWVSGEDSIPA